MQLAVEQLWPSYTNTQSSVGWDHLSLTSHRGHYTWSAPGHQHCHVSIMQPRLRNNDFYRIFIKLYNIGIIKI